MKIKLDKIGGKDVIVDQKGNIIVSDIHNVEEKLRSGKEPIIEFLTKDNEYSFINTSGLFFDMYSYEEYNMVCELGTYTHVYKFRKNQKYGIINSWYNLGVVLDCVFDEIIYLPSNHYVFDLHSSSSEPKDIVKVRRGNHYFLISVLGKYDVCKEYDFIYTPIQPLDKFIVRLYGKYGFISAITFEEIVEPVYDSIEDLCEHYNCNVDKYTIDLYSTENKIKWEKVLAADEYNSYIIDSHNIVKGLWGSQCPLISDERSGEIFLYCLDYSPLDVQVTINSYGYFSSLFDPRKYDVVVRLKDNLFLNVKDGKCGLIDNEFHVLLAMCYESIKLVHFYHTDDSLLFVVKCDDGEFLYNPTTRLRTRLYDSLVWQNCFYSYFKNYLVYKENNKYGLLSPEGDVIVKAKFDALYTKTVGRGLYPDGHAYFLEVFHAQDFIFYIENNKFYGKIPVDDYDSCFKIGCDDHYYIFKKDGQYGLLNMACKEVNLPMMSDILFPKHLMFANYNGTKHYKNHPISECFFAGYIEGKYNLYFINDLLKSQEPTLIISGCEELNFIIETSFLDNKSKYPYVHFKKNGIDGYVNEDGLIISIETFETINPVQVTDFNTDYYVVSENGKFGLLNKRRKVLLPCVYDDILEVSKNSAFVLDKGVALDIEYGISPCEKHIPIECDESQHYSQYACSYAQSEMGYSDEDIDIIFDGDPEAYWNID